MSVGKIIFIADETLENVFIHNLEKKVVGGG